MKNYFLIVLFAVFQQSVSAQKTYNYPIAPKDSIVDVYFDTTISDPYQWMENPNDPRLDTWLIEQERITKKEGHQQVKKKTLLAQIGSMYYDVEEENVNGYNKKDKKIKYQFKYNTKRYDRTPDLMYREKGAVIYKTLVKVKDFRHWRNDNIRIVNRVVNEEEDLLAIEITHSGSDWSEGYFFDLKSGQQLPDTLKYLRGSRIVWHGKNVYYIRYQKPQKERELLDKATGQTLSYHQLGTLQSEDKILYYNPDTTGTNSFWFSKKDDKLFLYHYYKYKGKYLRALSVANDDPNSFFLNNFLIYPDSEFIDISIEAMFGDTVIIRTNWNAPNGKVLMADINQLNKVVEIIPEYDIALQNVNPLGKDKFACIYQNQGSYHVLIFDLAGKMLKKIDFPEGKKVNEFYEEDTDAEYTDFSVSSFYHPELWFQLSLIDLTYKPITSLSVPYDPNSLETKYVEFTSKDGKQIPMYITLLKGTKLNGNNPTLLYGYGGYGRTVSPTFDESKALWLLHGGILAIPNIRGGGAKGSDWGFAGRRLNKQNAINDFIAAAEYLIEEDYTSPNKLAINGASHGGLLVGAAITQRPELFKVAIAEAGVFDMLRAENFTVGSVKTNLNEYGTVSDSIDFINLKSYSPIHNIKEGIKYPNLLLITGDHDDRVPPLHTYKFLATIQDKGSPESAYLLYVIPNAGHDSGQTSVDWTEYLLFKYYFLFDQLDLRFY